MAFNIADMIEYAVDAVPGRRMVIAGDRRLTYRDLDERANRLAHHLAGVGVGRGHHVAVYAYNSVEFIETMLATLKLRAVPINVNYRYVEEELRYLFDDADVVAVVHGPEFDPPFDGPTLEIGDAYEKALAAESPDRDFERRADDDHYVIYTGGTTGMPKGVVWRHEDVFRTLGGGIDFYTGVPVEHDHVMAERAAATDTPLVRFPVPPLMHGAAQWATFQGLFAGEPVVLTPRFDPTEVWRTVERERVNLILVTGDAMARPLVEALKEGDAGRPFDTSSLISFSSSAAIFSASVKDELLDLLPNAILTDSIGSSESGFGGMTIVQKGPDQTVPVQKGGPTVTAGPDALVLDDDNRPVAPGSGVIGRIARGGNLPIGYYNDPAKTAATFIEVAGRRYVVPGDYGTVEADGSITLLGRGSQCINTGGEKVFPEEVEGALKAHPSVYDVLVVGVPDERWGERVCAVIQPREGATPTLDEIQGHCRAMVAGYKVPRELHLVDEVQRLPSGKPDYPWAKRVAEQGGGTEERA